MIELAPFDPDLRDSDKLSNPFTHSLDLSVNAAR
ncbi:hypothetical protein BTI_1503 [Burkholderia thailandensis MSMB121]|nr:hypothetical protein BTI_1503 [Burkholderia thailandensis MSMB121]